MSVTILVGDVFDRLRDIPDNSVDVVVTSPPYWGLRDYGTATWQGGDPGCDHRSPTMRAGRDEQHAALAGSAATNSAQLLLAHRSACGKCGAMKVDAQIGLEPTLAEHLDVMVAVFREIRRVLKPTGTCWVNYGDCYATTPNGRSAADGKAAGLDDRTFRDKPMSTIGGGIKAKDLCMIPNRLAIALCDDGWFVRAECIWGKPNAMPDSSGSQRPAIAHEKVFMFTKSADADVWRARDTGELSFSPDLTERCALITDPERDGPRWLRIGSYYDAVEVLQGAADDSDLRGRSTNGRHTLGAALPAKQRRVKMPDGWDTGEGGHGSFHRQGREKGKTRAVGPKHDGHINHTGIANTPRNEGRYLRNYEPAPLTVWEIAIEPFKGAHFATFPTELARRCLLAGCPKGGSVLDPFGGAGTTALVANRMGLDATIIELNEDYAAMAARRLKADLAIVTGADAGRGLDPLPLFADRAGEAA